MAEWFEEWFGEEYLDLYPHRDDDDAVRIVTLVERTIDPRPGSLVLDICCGGGRHAGAFERRGFLPVGVDLSRQLLRRARTATRGPLVRADLRALPFRPGSVDLAVNLFTSFGYFERDEDHLAALRQMVAPVRPGGWFVLDFFNARWVRRTLTPREEVVIGEATVTVERWLHDDGRFVVKAITTPDGRQFMERVRLYYPEDLVTMVQQVGWTVRFAFGSYEGGAAGNDEPRVILFARAA